MRSCSEWPVDARHCLRLGSFSDKAVIDASVDHFDVLVVQGNLAVSAPQGLATWPLDKPIWIDPVTYAFVAAPAYLKSVQGGERRYKKTFLELAERFGSPFSDAVSGDRPVRANDFSDAVLAAAVQRVVDWQLEVFAPDEGDLKYGASALEPALLTLPFFPVTLSENGRLVDADWLRVNLNAIRLGADAYEAKRLAAGLLTDLDAFDHPDWQTVVDGYADTLTTSGVEHLWLWISDFDEVNASLARATRFLAAIDEFARRGVHVHQAFGGSFSSHALTRGLATVGHGVNYWESKGWEPIASGGLPSARYFHPQLRERLRVPEAVAIVVELVEDPIAFRDLVCGCEICSQVVVSEVSDFGAFGQVNIRTRRTRGGGVAEFDSPTSDALRLTKTHYLHAKGAEVRGSIAPNFDPVTVLQADAARWTSDRTRTRHLDRWAIAYAVQEGPGTSSLGS